MVKRLFLFAIVAAQCAAFVSAQTKLTIPVKPAPIVDGKQMFASYCASCHGLDGRGNGPTAAALKTAPVDLTQLSKNNKGSYPALHVIAVLKFGAENTSHGSKQMPIWGQAFNTLDQSQGATQSAGTLRISNLVNYIETLQVK